MRILVTGGSGFLGARMIPTLVADGHEVLALARSTSSAAKLKALGAVVVAGDLEQPEKVSLPPVDAVIHAAAVFRFAGPREPYFRTNVTGTRALLQAAEKAGARSFLYVSAGAVVMDDRGSPVRNVDESAPTYPDSFSAYIGSKAQAEALVLAANKRSFRTIAIRPPAIWGPGDAFSHAIPEAIESGKFAFIQRGDYPIITCHVDNVIEALVCALKRGAGGRAYWVADQETTTFRDFIGTLAQLQGLSIEKIRSMPYGLAFAIGRMMEIGASITFSKKDPPLSRTMVRMIGREFTASAAAARSELGYIGEVSRKDGLAMYRL
jgi:nucleoside-diphosphate-sugar epimerase